MPPTDPKSRMILPFRFNLSSQSIYSRINFRETNISGELEQITNKNWLFFISVTFQLFFMTYSWHLTIFYNFSIIFLGSRLASFLALLSSLRFVMLYNKLPEGVERNMYLIWGLRSALSLSLWHRTKNGARWNPGK